MRRRALVLPLAVVILGLAAPGSAQRAGSPARDRSPRDGTPAVLVGALLPVAGPAAWFGEEMKRGLELAALHAAPPRRAAPARGGGGRDGARPDGREAPGADRTRSTDADAGAGEGGEARETDEAAEPDRDVAGDTPARGDRNDGESSGAAAGESRRADPRGDAGSRGQEGDAARSGAGRGPSAGPAVPPRAADGRPAVRLTVQVEAVQPLDARQALDALGRLAGARVVFTASPAPTLAVHPAAAGRLLPLVHLGFRGGRLPPGPLLLHARPTPTRLGQALAAYAWERGLRRVAVVAAGDDASQAVRAGFGAGWRDRGAAPVAEEAVTLEAPDVARRLARVARLRPDAVVAALHGEELGELARRLREAGFDGPVLAADDDPAAALAAGPALTDLWLLTDAFAPVDQARSGRFAAEYQAKFGREPSRFAAAAYDAARLVAEALGAAGRPGAGPDRLAAAIRARGPAPSVFDGELALGADGTLEHPLALSVVHGGRVAFVRYVGLDGRPAPPDAAPEGQAGGPGGPAR
jgi:ABC-type branched-subunit amino acid transport system substrate-binding protein